MNILGIIAEYDPFHLGHERHLRLARQAAAPDETLIVLSGCFRQRGDLAMFSPRDRAACALSAGADAVFSLPVLYTVRSAEDYAFAAVSLLHSLGCTHISFGAETDDIDLLWKAADLLEEQSDPFREALHTGLNNGNGYPCALEAALGAALSGKDPSRASETARLLSRPNNTLAICYLRAIRRLRSSMKPVVIRREGSYRSDTVDFLSPSASALRSALSRGDWSTALPALPPAARSILSSAFLTRRVCRPEGLDPLLLSRLRSMTPEEASALPDISEGLERRLLKEAALSRSRSELLERVSSRRYSSSRVSRLCASALLGIHITDFPAAAEGPPEALLLALRPGPSRTGRWRNLSLHILSSLKETKNPPLWRADLQAWKIWALCAGLPDTLPYSERLFTLEES